MRCSVLDLQQILSMILDRLTETATADPPLHDDYNSALREFLGDRPADRLTLGRFHEWYLFERLSPIFGDAPAYLLLSQKAEDGLPREALDLLDELGANRFSVFELAPPDEEAAPGAIMLRDLVSQGIYALDGEQFEELQKIAQPGSLAIGRVYPTGRGTYWMGPYGFVVLGDVAAALRDDLLKGGQRGRLSQFQMERLLFGGANIINEIPNAPAAGDELYEPLERVEAELDTWIQQTGIEGITLADIRLRFEDSESSTEAVNSILEDIAFETDADLDVGRRLLPAYYGALKNQKPSGARRKATKTPSDDLAKKANDPCPCGSGEIYGNCCLQKDAVARFEAGRARGEGLNLLFAELEAAMGVEADDEAEEGFTGLAAPPPMEPMAAEYLWEMQQNGTVVSPAREASLAAFAKSIDGGEGAPEDLTGLMPEHLFRFLAFERYIQKDPPDFESLTIDAEAILSFAKWLRDEQSIDWFDMAGQATAAVLGPAKRLAVSNRLLGAGDVKSWNRAFSITGIAKFGGQFELVTEPVDQSEVRGRLQVPAQLGENLQIGDCLLVASDAEVGGTLSARLLRVLPGAARPYLITKTPPQPPIS